MSAVALTINGRTKLTGLFGDPVEHTLSPAMHNAAFTALGLNFVYVPFRVPKEALGSAVTAVRALGLAGVNVTVPHKEEVLPYLDHVSEEASLIGAVNTIVNENGQLKGYNTDARGFMRAVRETGFDAQGREAVVIGAGGAARAVCAALALAGVKRIAIFNRTYARGEALAAEVAAATGVETEALVWEELGRSGTGVLRAAEIVVQTTTLGMHPDEEGCPLVSGEAFRPGQLAVDLIYNPPQTRFLRLAAAAGAATQNGLAMLLHQGAAAFELWTKCTAPLEVMRRAVFGNARL